MITILMVDNAGTDSMGKGAVSGVYQMQPLMFRSPEGHIKFEDLNAYFDCRDCTGPAVFPNRVKLWKARSTSVAAIEP